MTSLIQQPLFTLGYGAREIDEFLDVIRRFGIRYVIDVRSVPRSGYRPDFSKGQIETHLREAAARYVFMGDVLGGRPDSVDCYSDGFVDYGKCRSHPAFVEGVSRVVGAWKTGVPTALMCSEGKPETCHRSKLLAEMLADADVPVMHIDQTGEIQTHAEVIDRVMKGQRDLFGSTMQALRSRKRYREPDANPESEEMSR